MFANVTQHNGQYDHAAWLVIYESIKIQDIY